MSDITDRLKELAHAAADQNWGEFSMRVPADHARDADLVLLAASKEITSLRTELTEARKPDCLLCKNYYEREDENDHSLYRGCALRLRLTPSDCINGSDFISVGPVRLYEREENA